MNCEWDVVKIINKIKIIELITMVVEETQY